MRVNTVIYGVASFAILAVVATALIPRPMPASPLAEIDKTVLKAKEEAKILAADPAPVEQVVGPQSIEQAAIAEPPAPALEPVRRDIRNVTPDHALPGPVLTEDQIVRLPAIVPPPPPPKPPTPERWRRALVIAPGILKSGDSEIVIAGVEPLANDAVCGPEGESWPCGNFAKSAMRRLIRQRPIECDPAGRADDGRIVTRCEVAGRDIGEWMVEQGWARPLDAAGDESLEKAFGEAREAGRGQWRTQALAALPEEELPQVDLSALRKETGNLLAPEVSAEDALRSSDAETAQEPISIPLPESVMAPPGSPQATAETRTRPSTGFPLAE